MKTNYINLETTRHSSLMYVLFGYYVTLPIISNLYTLLFGFWDSIYLELSSYIRFLLWRVVQLLD